MEVSLVIIFLGLLVFSAHIFNALFSKTKIPNVLWLLVIGIILGPVLKIVRPEHFGSVGPIFTTVTLILLLFESGTQLRIGELAKSIGSAFFLTLFNFIISAVIATVAARYLTNSLDWLPAAFFGVIVAGTSSAVVIPMIKQLKMNKNGETILLLESALSDVLCLVIGLALLTALKEGVFSLTAILDTVWKSFLFALLIGVFGGIVWSIFIHQMRTIKNYTFTNLAFVFIVYGVSEYLGLNGGIATLGFGIALGNAYLFNQTFMKDMIKFRELLPEERSFFSELVFILQTYFFVYVGVSIQFGDPLLYVVALLIVMAVIAVRPVSVKVFVREKMDLKELAIMGILTPKGLVPAILATIPLQHGIAGGEVIKDLSFAVVLLSILICAILVIILSNDPFAIGYLRMLLQGKSVPAVEEPADPISSETPAEDPGPMDQSGDAPLDSKL